MYTISELCELICNDNEKPVVGLSISPICKKEHNFIITNEAGMFKLLHGSYSDRQFLDFAKEMVPKECSYADFIKNIAYSYEFLLAYRKKFYSDIYLTDDVNVLVSKVKDIDFNVPQTRHGGLDGFALNYWMLGLDKEFFAWCCHYDDYYAPVTDLANALLDVMSIDKEYRFRVCKRT